MLMTLSCKLMTGLLFLWKQNVFTLIKINCRSKKMPLKAQDLVHIVIRNIYL